MKNIKGYCSKRKLILLSFIRWKSSIRLKYRFMRNRLKNCRRRFKNMYSGNWSRIVLKILNSLLDNCLKRLIILLIFWGFRIFKCSSKMKMKVILCNWLWILIFFRNIFFRIRNKKCLVLLLIRWMEMLRYKVYYSWMKNWIKN